MQTGRVRPGEGTVLQRPVRRTRHSRRSYSAIAVALILGGFLGGVLGELLGSVAPFLAKGQAIGLKPTLVDLAILKFPIGLELKVNVAGLVGAMAGAALIGRR